MFKKIYNLVYEERLIEKKVLVCNVKNTFIYKDIKLLEKIGFKVLLIYSPPYKDPLRFFYNRIKELVLSFFICRLQ